MQESPRPNQSNLDSIVNSVHDQCQDTQHINWSPRHGSPCESIDLQSIMDGVASTPILVASNQANEVCICECKKKNDEKKKINHLSFSDISFSFPFRAYSAKQPSKPPYLRSA